MFTPDSTVTHKGWRDPRRVLAVALALSALVHLALTQWPVHVAEDGESTPPLAVAITELPPPPAPVAAPVAKPKPKPRRAPPVATAEVPSASVVPEPAPEPEAAPAEAAPPEPPAAQAEAPETPPEVATAPPPEPIPPKALPPRVDLAYRAFLGTQRLSHRAGGVSPRPRRQRLLDLDSCRGARTGLVVLPRSGTCDQHRHHHRRRIAADRPSRSRVPARTATARNPRCSTGAH